MVVDVLLALASQVLILWAIATHPARASCPRGWWLPEGVRSSGDLHCRPVPPVAEGTGPRGGYLDLSEQPAGELASRVYCSGGSVPVTSDGVTVGCEARH